jgi:hypothetical protein
VRVEREPELAEYVKKEEQMQERRQEERFQEKAE